MTADHAHKDQRGPGGVATAPRPAQSRPSHTWVVIVGVVAEGTEPVIAMYSAHDGALPNEAEQAALKARVGGLFKERCGKAPERSTIAVLPWVEADGDAIDWKSALRRLGGR